MVCKGRPSLSRAPISLCCSTLYIAGASWNYNYYMYNVGTLSRGYAAAVLLVVAPLRARRARCCCRCCLHVAAWLLGCAPGCCCLGLQTPPRPGRLRRLPAARSVTAATCQASCGFVSHAFPSCHAPSRRRPLAGAQVPQACAGRAGVTDGPGCGRRGTHQQPDGLPQPRSGSGCARAACRGGGSARRGAAGGARGSGAWACRSGAADGGG